MAQHTAIIESMRDKIVRLIEDNKRLRGEYDVVSSEKEALKGENRRMKLTVAALEKRIGMLELSGSLTGGGVDVKQARARINGLMREIDRCIALMNKQ